MNDGALDYALEPRSGFGILAIGQDDVLQLAIKIAGEILSQYVDLDIAGPHDRRSVLIVAKRQEQVLEGCIFVAALRRECEGAVQGVFQIA